MDVALGTGIDGEDKQSNQLVEWINSKNIAEDLDDAELGKIGSRAMREYKIDYDSCEQWRTDNEEAIKLALQITEAKTYPWPGASNVIYPLVTDGAMQFAARAYPAIINGKKIVKGVVVGKDEGTPQTGPDGRPVPNPQNPQQPLWKIKPGEKQMRADNISAHMSWQCLSQMKEWEDEVDKLLHVLPIVGTVFKKCYHDPKFRRNFGLMVRAENLVINYRAKSMELATRLSEELSLYPQEIEANIRAGLFLDQVYGAENDEVNDEDAPRKFIEQHRWLDLDDDGFREPYIVTVHKQSQKVARIVARYTQDTIEISPSGKVVNIEAEQFYIKYDFLPSMDGGIYGTGLGRLLRPINAAVNTTLNMMIDTGHLNVVASGFIGKGLSMHTGQVRFKPGEWKTLNVPGNTIKEAMVQLQFPEPSQVLFALLGMLVQAGEKIGSIKDVLTGDMSTVQLQPTTLLALIEQGLKVFTGIFKRIRRGMKAEYQRYYELNRDHLSEDAEYQEGDEWKSITKEDYAKGAGVEPIADENMVSDAQRLARAQLLHEYKDDPLCNPLEIRRRIFQAANVEEIDKIIPDKMPPQPPPPLVVFEGIRVHQEGLKTASTIRLQRAQELSYIAGAIKAMTEAKKTASEDQQQWVQGQLDVLQQLMASVSQGAAGEPPVEGAAQAPDGNWYMPSSEGGFNMVQQ